MFINKNTPAYIENKMFCSGGGEGSSGGDGVGYGEGKVDPGLAAAAGIGPAASGFSGTTKGHSGKSGTESFGTAVKNSMNLTTGLGVIKAVPVLGTFATIGEVMSRMGGTTPEAPTDGRGGDTDQRRAVVGKVQSNALVEGEQSNTTSLIDDTPEPKKNSGVIQRIQGGLF